jgi:hypothetical protein
LKKLVAVQEVDGEGFEALLGERVLLMCANYFYTGKLIGVNTQVVCIEDPAIVYQTGAWSDKGYADEQKLHLKVLYVQTASIEAFGQAK